MQLSTYLTEQLVRRGTPQEQAKMAVTRYMYLNKVLDTDDPDIVSRGYTHLSDLLVS